MLTMFNYDLKFLTNDESLYLKSSDFKSFKWDFLSCVFFFKYIFFILFSCSQLMFSDTKPRKNLKNRYMIQQKEIIMNVAEDTGDLLSPDNCDNQNLNFMIKLLFYVNGSVTPQSPQYFLQGSQLILQLNVIHLMLHRYSLIDIVLEN